MPNGIFSYTCLGLSVTLACPLTCRHCITNSSPHIRDQMSIQEAFSYIREAKGIVDHISITGGEPFLDLSRLRTLIAEAKKCGYIVSVMTNAYWAVDWKFTYTTLANLKKDGLDVLGVSLDPYHLEFIGEDRCIRVAEAADSLEIPVHVRVISAKGDNYGDHAKSILNHTNADIHVHHPVRLGRACSLPMEHFCVCHSPPADACETVTALDIVPGGDVYACCGPGKYMKKSNPLYLGNASRESLREILERGLTNPFMKVINTCGPKGFIKDLHDRGLSSLLTLRRRYSDTCQLCLDVTNNPKIVKALQNIYADKNIQREKNALQFLKMFQEYKALPRNPLNNNMRLSNFETT
ncbi:MAG: radical SAM protein [Candidatus Methanoperedens sp.]|nr:radical SAM protein [Candidatus Methanoperedens sp.]